MGIGTLNVQGLTGKLSKVILLMQTLGMAILCLQEVRVPEDSIPSAQAAAQACGYSLHFSLPDRDEAGRPYSGTAVLSSWPTGNIDLPAHLDRVRYMAVAAHRPGQRPLTILNHYGDAKDAAKRKYDADGALK